MTQSPSTSTARYSAIFLDVDDTLLTFRPSSESALRLAFEDLQLPYEPAFFEVFFWIGEVLWGQQKRELLSADDIRKVIFHRLLYAVGVTGDGTALGDAFYRHLYHQAVREPQVREALTYLSTRYQLYVASNGVLEMQRSRLRQAELLNYFTNLFVSDDIGAEKPSTAFFEEALRRAGLTADQVLFIGDSLGADMVGAERIGMDRCWYNPSESPVPEFPPLTYTISELSQLEKFL